MNLRNFLSLFFLCMVGCNPNNQYGMGGRLAEHERAPLEPNKPVDLAKVTAVFAGVSHACALDEQNKVACWRHPTKFVPMDSEEDYPKKSNTDLVGHKFIDIAGSGSAICALRDDAKVLCFIPNDSSVKLSSDLNGLGRFTKIAVNYKGYFCAIDTNNLLTCHKLDLVGREKKYYYAVTEEVTELVLNEEFGCWITKSNILHCEPIANWPENSPPKEEASKLAGNFEDFSIATLSLDRKSIKFFGRNRKIVSNDVEELDLTQGFSDISVSLDFCGILASTNEVKCQHRIGELAKKTNDDLQQEKFNQISVGHSSICGLRKDKTSLCWKAKDYQPGVPKNIMAE